VEVVVARIAGLDVHKDTVMVCVRTPDPVKGRAEVVREFRTFTGDLLRLRDWLVAEGVSQAVMEATGVYWKPVWPLLEEVDGLELMLVNAHHVKNLPGRKTDVSDAAWLAQLGECGLLRGSFVPPPVIARLRDLTRYRQRTAEVVIAEIGVDMTRFPTSAHLASWVGLCPGNHESAGKRKSGRARKGNAHLAQSSARKGT
jgi:transposase